MFGFNTISLDVKGRISIPARYREDLKLKNLSKDVDGVLMILVV